MCAVTAYSLAYNEDRSKWNGSYKFMLDILLTFLLTLNTIYYNA